MKLSQAWVAALAMWIGGASATGAPETYGPVTELETLSEIALKFRPGSDPVSTGQTALAIYWANPDAFLGSINRLKPGAQLKLPPTQSIRAVDPALARKIYSEPGYAFPSQPPTASAGASTDNALATTPAHLTAVEVAAAGAVSLTSAAPRGATSGPSTYGPVSAKETLHSIALKVRHERTALATTQAAVALYWNNPGAFRGGIHGLKPGSVLQVPAADAIRSVDPQIAAKLYSDPKFDFPKQWPAGAAPTATDTALLPATPAPVVMAVSAPVVVAAAEPSPAPEAPPAPKPAPALAPPAPPPPVAAPAPAGFSTVQAAPADEDDLGTRRRPGQPNVRPAPAPLTVNPNRETELLPVAPPPQPWKPEAWTKVPLPDRWRILNNLDLLPQRWYDPYNQNTWKGDKPVRNGDEFAVFSAIFDGIWEPRRFPQPVGPQATSEPGATGIFGGSDNTLYAANLLLSFVYLKGDTTFKPPDWEYHFAPAINFNYARADERRVLEVNPANGDARTATHIGIQELFVDYHIRNVSDRYDFDSWRIGIQPFSADFRGFLFQDNQLMLRLFGTRDNNLWQYNLAWMRRLEKDTNTALNAIERPLREDDTFIANLYRQDWPVLGFTSQGIVAHNRNREGDGRIFFNDNGFTERPASIGTERARSYEVTYLGYNGDGHFGRLNLTVSGYLAVGQEERGTFTDRKRDILAGFAAAEASIDQDWIRWRLSGMYQSADDDPFDDEANGYDAIFENPIFAGADTSFWFRQSVPLIGGGIVNLSQRNGLLNDLRSSKEHGQSNFANPGLGLLGIGNDMDLSPQVRLSTNINHLWFMDTTTLEVARNQAGIRHEIGWDVSAALIWRPFFQQNVIFRLSGAYLLPGDGFEDLFPDEEGFSVLGNLTLVY